MDNRKWFEEPVQIGDSLKRPYTMDDFVTDVQRKRITSYNYGGRDVYTSKDCFIS